MSRRFPFRVTLTWPSTPSASRASGVCMPFTRARSLAEAITTRGFTEIETEELAHLIGVVAAAGRDELSSADLIGAREDRKVQLGRGHGEASSTQA